MMASFSRKSSQKSSSRRSHSLIESPIVKRTQNQPVTLQSWLLKRGSEGLMLWKKRWCVLSDYCLFYYKDQSEEKLLGSLILASYEISACNPEEKGFKKFSFKAEHANMKTFYFAAENQLHMEEWMKALKCASVLEGNYSDDRKKLSDMRIFHESSKHFEEPQSTINNDMILGGQKTSEAQPVYVNAPPKPKRLNESSSPECSIEIQIRDDNYHSYLGQPYHIQSNLSGPQNFTMQPQHANYERRTPDIYGRASFVHPITKPVNLNNLYIQDEQNILSNLPSEQIISYTPKHSSSVNSHSRPHSVDFLEYHSKNSSSAIGSDIVEKPSIPYRPKSSLSAINSNEEEGTHWSAEEYARKMRQSSMYVKPLTKSSLPIRTETLLVNKNLTPKNTIYASDSPGIKHDPVMKSENTSGTLYRAQHALDNNEKPFFRSASARLFRALSPVTPKNEFKQQASDHKIHETSGSSRDSEIPVSNLSPINKHHMRDKPLERLLLWKERMSQSPLQRKNAEKIINDQHSSYISQKKKISSSLSSNDSRNENCEFHATNNLLPFCGAQTDELLKDISLQDHLESPSPLSLSDYSPDHHGIDSRTGENAESIKEAKKSEKPISQTETNYITQPEHEQGHGWNLKVSAGELLGRTHEELVLLLIQLRRQRATVCQSMEKCHREIEAQACLTDLDKTNRVGHLQKLDELKARLADLEKQYEKGKPLVNLVDNMVKLGSLYQAGSPEKIEFIQRIQEQRLLAEEKRDWERIRPDHHELKAKVERLYRLDKLLQEESGTLHSLQQDKGVLERALGGLRTKLQGIHGNSPETEWYKRQQRLLEKELSRVRSILALNSKKLEETVAENARLEQELVVLRQKLQLSRRTAEPGGTNTAALEAELCQVQLLVGNLLRQRQELSLQVRQLTEKSNSLSRQIWPNSTDNIGDINNAGKKNLNNGWVETDLDAEVTNDVGSSSYHSRNGRQHPVYVSPLYVNTTSERDIQCNSNSPYPDDFFETAALSSRNLDFSRLSEMNDEEIIRQSYGFHLKEKPQEIKTVRIVKRESERRQRDRDRSGNIGIPISSASSKRLPITEERCIDKDKNEKELVEEAQIEVDSKLSEVPPTPGPRTDSVNAVWNLVRKNRVKGKLMINKNDMNDSLVITNESPQLSPVYLSETARKIVEEVAWQGMGEKRLIPKEKRRHHTVSGPSLGTPQTLYSQTGSRDDLDIERVLRPRLTTPDVVRSTLIRVDPHYTKETIDNLLGAPGKILIPERYIPETQPQLTKEEQNKRSKKADAIRRMLCETTAVSPKDNDTEGIENTSSLRRKVAEEKKNREHLLQLSHILAQQVMEKSKIVAGGNSTPLD